MGFVENINKLATDLTAQFITVVNTVFNDRGSITTVANDIANVNTNAANIADLNNIATNLPEILLADDNAAIATAQAGIATAQADIATAQAAIALAQANVAISILDQIDDRYLGDKASDPLTDNDGNPLMVGALYWNTTNNEMMVWDGVQWTPSLAFTASSPTTFSNKTLDSITNFVGADHVHYACRNASGGTINAGTIVTAQGTQSGTDYIEIVPVTNPQTQVALGILHTTLANNATGLVINTGLSTDVIDTSGWAVGTILYPNNAGGLTATKPTSGQYQACAVVLRSHANQGTMLVEFTEPKYLGSTTQPGYVQLYDGLDSASTTLALTAGQGKALQDGKANADSLTGAVFLGSWNTLGRPTLDANARAIGYNTDLATFEGWNGTIWGAIGGGAGATGGGGDEVFMETSYAVTTSYTLSTGKSAITIADANGNVTVADSAIITIPDNSIWVIQGV